MNPNTGATNETGFTGFPVCSRDNDFYFSPYEADWWSSTESDASTSIVRAVNNTSEGIYSFPIVKYRGTAVRCVKDN